MTNRKPGTGRLRANFPHQMHLLLIEDDAEAARGFERPLLHTVRGAGYVLRDAPDGVAQVS